MAGLQTLAGKTAYLAHQDINSELRIRRYGVSIRNIDTIAVPSISSSDNSTIIILDEIGKMECFSEDFKTAAVKILDSPNIVIGTITLGGDDFIASIRNRQDIEVLEVNQDNRNALPDVILRKISDLHRSYEGNNEL